MFEYLSGFSFGWIISWLFPIEKMSVDLRGLGLLIIFYMLIFAHLYFANT